MFFMRTDRVVVLAPEGEIGRSGPFGLGACEPPISITVETRSLLRLTGTRHARGARGTGCQIRGGCLSSNRANGRRSISVGMNSDEKWSRRRAVEVHDETADGFFAEYRGNNIFDSPFRYGRHLINRAWTRCVSQLPPGATCLDIGCGVGAHMVPLLDHGLRSPASNRVPRCADWRQKTYQRISFPTTQCCNCQYRTPRSTSSTRSRF